jgi:hypothetical protein
MRRGICYCCFFALLRVSPALPFDGLVLLLRNNLIALEILDAIMEIESGSVWR